MLDLRRGSFKARVRRARLLCQLLISELVVTVSSITQQMHGVERTSVVEIEIASDPGFKYFSWLARQAKYV